MEKIRPVYRKLLIAAIIVFVAGVAVMISDIYMKVGKVEHALMHMSAGHGDSH